MDYVLAIMAFVATIISFKNQKFETNLIAKISFGVALSVLIFTVGKIYFDEKKSKNNEQQIIRLQNGIDSLQTVSNSYEHLLESLAKIAERQEQWVSVDYYYLTPNQERIVKAEIFAGSIIRVRGNCKKLGIEVNGRTEIIYNVKNSNLCEIPAIGKSGEISQVIVKNLSNEPCDFKLYVLSTPRVRSTRSSNFE